MLSKSGLYVDAQLCSVLLAFCTVGKVRSVSNFTELYAHTHVAHSYVLLPTYMYIYSPSVTNVCVCVCVCVCVGGGGESHRSQHYQFSSETSCIMLHHQRQDIDSVKSENTQLKTHFLKTHCFKSKTQYSYGSREYELHTSLNLVNIGNDRQTDGQTDRRTDRQTRRLS